MTQPPSDPAQPGYRPQPVAPPYNTYAIVALALAIFVLPPLGVYFGYVARRQIAATGERGIELAQAAIVVGWILTAIMAAGLLVFCGFFLVWLGVFGALAGAAATGG